MALLKYSLGVPADQLSMIRGESRTRILRDQSKKIARGIWPIIFGPMMNKYVIPASLLVLAGAALVAVMWYFVGGMPDIPLWWEPSGSASVVIAVVAVLSVLGSVLSAVRKAPFVYFGFSAVGQVLASYEFVAVEWNGLHIAVQALIVGLSPFVAAFLVGGFTRKLNGRGTHLGMDAKAHAVVFFVLAATATLNAWNVLVPLANS